MAIAYISTVPTEFNSAEFESFVKQSFQRGPLTKRDYLPRDQTFVDNNRINADFPSINSNSYEGLDYSQFWNSIRNYLDTIIRKNDINLVNNILESSKGFLSEILEIAFDITVKFLLSIQFNSEKKTIFSFQFIFNFFQFLGLEKIPITTINTIILAIQRQQISSDWVKESFLVQYYERLPINIDAEYKERIKDLISAIRSGSNQEKQKKLMFAELNELLLDNFTDNE